MLSSFFFRRRLVTPVSSRPITHGLLFRTPHAWQPRLQNWTLTLTNTHMATRHVRTGVVLYGCTRGILRKCLLTAPSILCTHGRSIVYRRHNRWLSKDYSSSWSQDPMLELNRPPEVRPGAAAGDHRSVKKGSGWVSTRSSSGFGGGGGGGKKRSYGGGSSSSATGGGW